MNYSIIIIQEYGHRLSKTGKSISREPDDGWHSKEITLGFDKKPNAELLEELTKAAAANWCSLIFPVSEAHGLILDNRKGRHHNEQRWRATHEPNLSVPNLEKIA